MKFIGRKKQLETLELLLKKKSASLVVIRGRRRVGKSRLISEFVSGKNSWLFTGHPPVPGITKQQQLDLFADQISRNLKLPKIQVSEWVELFVLLANQAKGKKIIIVFDEITWMLRHEVDWKSCLRYETTLAVA
jgi:AAA+ ATPase superfamily predicted ATPase